MTEDEFRKLALALPEASEASHMGHPDFRVGGKIFATLGHPERGWAMVKLTPDQQEVFVRSHSSVFVPVSGGWGARGATNVHLQSAGEPIVRDALETAWRNTAPKRLLRIHDV
jgi:hypothetical protein